MTFVNVQSCSAHFFNLPQKSFIVLQLATIFSFISGLKFRTDVGHWVDSELILNSLAPLIGQIKDI